MKRVGQPAISQAGINELNQYRVYLQQSEDVSPVTIRNYLSDLRQFIAWCEASWRDGQEDGHPFVPTSVVTPTLTRYRSYLQNVLRLKPASVNRSLVSLKRYFAWATDHRLIQHDQGVTLKEKTCVCSLQQASVPSGANSFPLGTPPIRRAPVGIDSGSYHFFVPLPRLCSTGLK
jgi:site-specific recombinase XerD